MADPEVDHEFAYNAQGEIDILLSPFFDPHWDYEDSVESYVDHILYHLVEIMDVQRPTGHWQIVGRPSISSPPATSPANKALCVTCLVVASLGFLLGCYCNQANHRITTNIQRRIYGHATNVEVRPLNEEKAVQAAADLIGELFVFVVASMPYI
ncbi:hypothetical protein IEQ34_021074 [Dendrobium chrysotoxum]|uniref:Uncharacterized protein n=1 Tax=Dendrobium chrysotoxum TaxID=161865 RepID=A0AAV7G3U0_DENCH|nr:hypothetical protein IEQ34_021074 [Dendrobium chrysotoxum]